MHDCLFLEMVPPELRIRIYEHLLRFTQPIKLRQQVAGERDLAILRVSRQVNGEALAVLYDLNRIVVTRNDFCKLTDDRLKTPIKLNHVRHLLITSFSQSIACVLIGRERQCDVCDPSATGLIRALTSLSRIQTVLVDYHKHVVEMTKFRDTTGINDDLRLENTSSDSKTISYRLFGSAVEGILIDFICGRDWLDQFTVSERIKSLMLHPARGSPFQLEGYQPV